MSTLLLALVAVVACDGEPLNVQVGRALANPTVLSGHTQQLSFLATTPDGRWLLTGATDNTARIWDLKSKQDTARFVLRGHTRKVSWVAMTPDRKRAVTAGYDGMARVWNLDTKTEITTLPAGRTGSGPRIGEKGQPYDRSLNCVAISPDGRWILTGDIRMTALLWDMNARDPKQSVKLLEVRDTAHFPYDGGRHWLEISRDGK